MMRALALAVVLAVLCGCVNQSATLVASDGRVSSCSAAGFGLLSMIMAQQRYDDCIATAQARGFR